MVHGRRWLIGTLVVGALAAALALTTPGGQESVARQGKPASMSMPTRKVPPTREYLGQCLHRAARRPGHGRARGPDLGGGGHLHADLVIR